jgi:predicted TPR repeat methyltransferase
MSQPQDPTRTTRTVTFQEALSLGIELQRGGRLDEAGELYAQLLAAAPRHPDVLHFAGVLSHHQGDGEKAIALMRESLAVSPNQASCLSNLGIALQDRGRLEEAIAAYRDALRVDPSLPMAHNNLGVLLRAMGHHAEAEAEYRAAIQLAPDRFDAHHNLAVLLASTGREAEAVPCFYRAITLNPAMAGSRTLLALAYGRLGQPEKAIGIFEEWLQLEPENPVARHMLAASTGRDVPARAPDAYVESTFDAFAASFDSKLATLEYRAPQLVAAAVVEAGIAPARALAVLDAGCGTGLCGPLLAPYARRLVGVDLSAGMLAQAAARGVYDELVKHELTAFLAAQDDAFDLVVSADTLVYFGALDAVLRGAAQALRPGGLLVFTVEELGGADAGGGFRLEHHGRYSHGADYVRATLEAVGLRPGPLTRAELRMEGGKPVAGLVVRASSPT